MTIYIVLRSCFRGYWRFLEHPSNECLYISTEFPELPNGKSTDILKRVKFGIEGVVLLPIEIFIRLNISHPLKVMYHF